MITENDILATLIAALKDVDLSRQLAVSAITLFLYDWSIVFADELELVGRARLSLGKILYYFSRIITPIGLTAALYQLSEFRGHELTKNFCVIFTFICPLMEVMSIFASYWLLMLRIVALYKRIPWVVIFLYALLFASYFATLGLLLRAQVFFSYSLVYSPAVGICVSTARAPTIAGIFYAPLAFELVLFSMIVFHAWRDYKSQADVTAILLLRVLYRDGVFNFVIMVTVRIWNIFIYTSQSLTRTYLGVYMLWGVVTVLSSRTYLNLVQVTRNHAERMETVRSIPTADSAFRRTQYPKVVGRPLPVRKEAPRLEAMNSEIFYSEYFQDDLAFDPVTLERGTLPDSVGPVSETSTHVSEV